MTTPPHPEHRTAMRPDTAPNLTIGPLEPGLYVIEVDGDMSAAALAEMQHILNERKPPGFDFLVLANGARIARNPEAEGDRLTL